MFRNLSTVGLPLTGRSSELIELALSFGFDAMDIDLVDFHQQAEAFGAEHARRLMVSARLKTGVFSLPVDLAGDDETFSREIKLLPKRLESARSAEAPRAVATLPPASDAHAFNDFFDLIRRRLEAVEGPLAKYGVMLGLAVVPEIEARAGRTHEFIHTLEGLLGLVEAAGPQVGVVVDAWAMHVSGESLSLLSKVPAGKIIEVRLSDAPRERAAAELSHADRLLPGETGVIACGAVLQAAEKAGFNGPVTPWADRSAVAGRGREKLVKLAGDRMEAVWKDAGLPILPRWFLPAPKDGAGRDGFEFEGLEPAKNAAGRLVGQGN